MNTYYIYYVQDLFRAAPANFIAASLVTYAILFFVMRRQFVAIDDFLHVAVILISAYASILVVPFLTPTFGTIAFAGLLWLYFAGMFVAFYLAKPLSHLKRIAERRRRVFVNTLEGKLFAWTILVFIVANAFLNVLASDFVVGETPLGQRFTAMNSNPLLKYTGGSLSFFSAYMVYVYRGTVLGFVAIGVLALVMVQGFFVGSKAFLLYGVLYLLYISYLAKLDNPTYKPPRAVLYAVGLLAVIGVPIGVVYIGAAEGGYGSGFQHFLERLFLGMQHLAQAGLQSTTGYVPELSLVEFYFAPVLKVLGLYNNLYDGINHYFVVNVLGVSIDYDAMRPNHNLLLELVYTQGWLFAIILTPLLSFAFYRAYFYFRDRRWDSFFHATVFVFLTSAPFGWLISGQGWFANLIGVLLVYAIWFFISLFIHLPIRKGVRVRY